MRSLYLGIDGELLLIIVSHRQSVKERIITIKRHMPN